MAYTLLILAHILCVAAAFGSNLTYSLWFARGAREPEHLDFCLRGIRALDDWVANPAWAGVGVSGALLVATGGLAWSLLWIWMALLLLALTSVLGLGVYRPLLRRQIAALKEEGPLGPRFLALSRQGERLGYLFWAINLTVFLLMVFKPSGI